MPEVTSSDPVLVGGDDQAQTTRQSLSADQGAAAVVTQAVLRETCTEMLNVLKQMKTLQKEMIDMKREKTSPGHNLSQLAQSIWTAFRNASEHDTGFGLPPQDDAAHKFFDGFCPSSNDNSLKAHEILQKWMAGPTPEGGEPWNDSYLTNFDLKTRILDAGQHLWPDGWPKNGNINARGICTGPSISDPFSTAEIVYHGSGELRRESEVLLSSPE